MIYVMAAYGSGLVELTLTGGRDVWDVIWSPDGSKLAVRDRQTGTYLNPYNLWVLNADGSGGLVLVASGRRISPPACSPDGQRLMYYVNIDSPRTLQAIGASTPSSRSARHSCIGLHDR